MMRSTFRGRFAQSNWAHDGGRDHDRRHHHLGFVLGFAGGVFWPYAYDDFVDYTFWPSAYDTFWPYAYDDVYEGWVYALVSNPGGALFGIFVTKDFGENWTEVNIPTEPNQGYQSNPAIPINEAVPLSSRRPGQARL